MANKSCAKTVTGGGINRSANVISPFTTHIKKNAYVGTSKGSTSNKNPSTRKTGSI